MYFKKDVTIQEKFNKLKIFYNEKVAIIGSNSENYLKLLISLLITGAVVMPLNPKYPMSKIYNCLLKTNCNKLIIEENLDINDIKDDISDISGINLIPPGYFDDNFKEIGLMELVLQLKAKNINEIINNNATIIFSSGSSGVPKAVLHTIGNHYFSALGSNYNIELKEGDCWLISLPLNHLSGFSTLFKSIISGAKIKVKDKNLSLIEMIKKNSITHISLIPSQLSELIENINNVKILKKLKAILLGGAPTPYFLVEEAKNLNLPIFVSYGSTEMSSQITCTLKNDSLKHLKTSGKLLKYRELKINEENEILVKGWTLFKGYVDKDKSGKEVLLKPFDKEGWFKTGDLGFIDEEGYLHVSGRKDFMFFYKGEKIFPEEIENALKEIREINDALVVSIPEREENQVPVAFIKSKNFNSLDFELIKKILHTKIESYKIPQFFLNWPESYEKELLKPDREEFKNLAIKQLKK